MLLETFITTAIETLLNKLIKDNPKSAYHLSPLKEQIIQIHLKELDKTITFIFNEYIHILGNYEGHPHCYLSFYLSDLFKIYKNTNIAVLIKEDKLTCEGNIKLAQCFSQIIADCEPDMEEYYSYLTGDVIAHMTTQSIKKLTLFIKNITNKHKKHITYFLNEECSIIPSSLEIEFFCNQVKNIKKQISCLEKSLNSLSEIA
ncbi:hypothetical protein CF66_1022 [Candidatus Photodesmus katoptron]|uniref:Ubiquinone biosynthesis accessory factor UbiJ n=1 Tax=Candidatus Photodesmus katoptron Akat1 TaxID=1236703 RepID=S3EIJ8_9GAMM|nr:SCP2 sterol-binding domain-containing protein [Candidatus Photodesmus katoptron]EPE38013.1 hypothetical protein O1U_0476 [Candidatus Photodesmus katoptron Akat1]KEY90753.1 hypothetical protein CF66_1022 [Candidatus Photodesmus katoptron]